MSLENQVAIWMLAGLTIYTILGSADFGGGIWSMLASGPRAPEMRKSISHAMGPVWEANHTWLVFFFIVMLSAFPLAFRALSIAMYVPFHLVLAGIVLRGTAFVFHNQQAMKGTAATFWANTFGIASIITPLGMGAALAAVTTGNILVQGTSVTAQPTDTWMSPFALLVGVLAVVTCAFLAAVFLTMETTGDLQNDFRRRALWAGSLMVVLTSALLLVSLHMVPRLESLHPGVIFGWLALSYLLAAGTLYTLYRRQYAVARIAAVMQVLALFWGWAAIQWPYIIYPYLSFTTAASPASTIRFMLIALPIGTLLLVPSLILLFWVFKRTPVEASTKNP